jgi:hypothetical protein
MNVNPGGELQQPKVNRGFNWGDFVLGLVVGAMLL